jgi:trigger factor
MNVTVDHLGPCKKLVRVEVPVEKVNEAFEEVTGHFQKAAQLPGFRPGKVPRHLIVKSFDQKIHEEARRKLFQESFRHAMDQEKLRVITTLNVEDQQFGRGTPYGYNVTCEVAPEFTLPEYKGLKARRELAVPSDSDVERAMNILREQHVKYNDVDRELREGDIAVVNYHGTTEGKPLTDIAPAARGFAEKQKTWIAIAKDSFIPGFAEQLAGAKAGDKRTVQLTLPSDFVVPELANRPTTYEVEILEVKEKILPEVTEEFAKGFGASSVDELIAGVRRDLQSELDHRQRRAIRDQLLNGLLRQIDCELPESVVGSETRNLVFNIVNENQKRGIAREVIEDKKDDIYKAASANAKDRIKAAFILGRIAEKEGIKTNEKEVLERVAALAEQNNTTTEKMAKLLQERNAFSEIANELVTNKVLDFLEVNAQIDEVPVARA